MNLNEYLKQQDKLQKELNHPMGKDVQAIKENVLAAIVELTEVLQETPWKSWRRGIQFTDREVIIEELVDVFKFYCNILNEFNITEQEFDELWDLKTSLVIARYQNEHK